MNTDSNSSANRDAQHQQLAALLLAAQDARTFTAPQQQELNDLLRTDEANREFAAQYLLDSESLKELLATEEISALSTGQVAKPLLFPRLRRRLLPLFGCAAAVILGGLLLFTWTNRTPIGVIRDQAGAVFAAGSAPLGAELTNQSYSLTAGMIAVEFSNGVSMTVKAPAEFEVVDEFRVRLHHGFIRAIAPESGHGFVIETPDADIKDLGTEFGVSVSERSRKSEVHVFDGRVDVNSRGGKTALTSLEFGESASISRGQLGPANSPLPGQFLSPADVSFSRWQTQADSIRNDPDLLLYYSFTAADEDESLLRDESRKSPAINGTINGARWVSGRWPDKKALLFDQATDAVIINIPTELSQFTFAAWVNLDRFDDAKSSILSSIGWTEGSLHLHVPRNNQAFIAGVFQPVSKSRKKVRLPTGRWVLLTAVIDTATQTTQTWINGQFASQSQFAETTAINSGSFVLGGYFPESGAELTRKFRGRIDEVVLWQRLLDDSEIKRLYQAGRPDSLFYSDL